MAIGAGTFFEVRPSGSDANGGGFNPENTNFATDLAATSATGGSPVVSSASYTFVAGDVGARVFVKSGTNWTPGWYPVASVAGGSATLNAAAGAVVLYNSNSPRVNASAGCATTASPTGGTWGLDYSQQDSSRYAFTDLVIDGTTNTNFTSAANPVGKNFVGNLINVTGGTGFTVQVVEVVSTSGTVATADKSLGTLSSTGGTGALGGGLAGIARAVAVAVVAGNVIWVKNGSTYALTGNAIAPSVFSNPTVILGYGSYRGDDGIAAFDASGMNAGQNTFSIGDHVTIANIKVSNSKRDSFSGSGQSTARNCQSFGAPNQGFEGLGMVVNCYSDTSFASCGHVHGSVARGSCNSGNGGHFTNCIFWGTGAQTVSLGQQSVLINCVAYKAGFVTSSQPSLCVNNVSWGSTSTAFARLTEALGRTAGAFLNNAYGSATSGVSGGSPVTDGPYIILTANPFTAPDSGDFSLNNTPGGGALLRAAGFPGVFPNISTTGYVDVGAAQHQDSGGGGTTYIFQVEG